MLFERVYLLVFRNWYFFSQYQIPLNTLKEKYGAAIAALYFGGSGEELK